MRLLRLAGLTYYKDWHYTAVFVNREERLWWHDSENGAALMMHVWHGHGCYIHTASGYSTGAVMVGDGRLS